MVEDLTLHVTIAALAVLAYALVTATLATLAARVRQQRHRHDLILTARLRRSQYLGTIGQQRAGQAGGHPAAADTDADADVDIV